MIKNYIFIIDLDGTIIGDCNYQCEIYNIENLLKKNGIKCNYNNILKKSYNVKSKLVRPNFIEFINTIKSKLSNVSFYVYTASEKKWANKEIKLIEDQNDIKINRPIFTRDNCIIDSNGSYKKSINKILKKKITNNTKVIIIDDNNVYIDHTENLIICPRYTYKFFYNLWDIIPQEALNIKEIEEYVQKLINNKILCPYNSNNLSLKSKIKSYKWLYKTCYNIKKENKIDNFWKNMLENFLKSI